MTEGRVIAIVGAESTGKSTLALALADRLTAQTGLRCSVVGEYLREWCDQAGRTPRPAEQRGIAEEQLRRVRAARAANDVVLADTMPLMVAVYSLRLFADDTLVPMAIAAHAEAAVTLLTALDLPWVADGLQRDGPQVREPVDSLLRDWLIAHRLPWALVGGVGAARVDHALDAVAPLLRGRPAPRRGLFSRLDERNAEPAARAWFCENCDDAACEHLARRMGRGGA